VTVPQIVPFVSEENRDALKPFDEVLLAVQRIESNKKEQWTTYLVAVTTNSVIPLSNTVYDFPDEAHIEWAMELSPDGQALAYESDDGGDREIFLAKKNRVFNVSNHRSADWNPAWSPDGKWITYDTFRNDSRAIFRAHRDSGRSLSILQAKGKNFWDASWSLDGSLIVCLQEENDTVRALLFSVESGEYKVLTIDAVRVSAPRWRPE
jgi:Tol biopolymer transport system component